jgi:hypothetical protein
MPQDPVREAQRALHPLTQTVEWLSTEDGVPRDGSVILISNGYWCIEVRAMPDGRYFRTADGNETHPGNALWWMKHPLGPLYLGDNAVERMTAD